MIHPFGRLVTLLLSGLCCLAWQLPAAGAETATGGNHDHVISPESIDGVETLDAEGLIERVTHMPTLVLIDSRIRPDRDEGYIEGSVNLPDVETNCAALSGLLHDRDTPVLFYCNGIHCGRSAKAAVIARDCGYRSVYWFRTGMEEWREKQYPLVQ